MSKELDLDDVAAQSQKAQQELTEMRDFMAATADALDYLTGLTPAQAGKLCKDAERYRKWRAAYTNPDGRPHAIAPMLAAIADAWTPEQLDAAIDAAPAVGAA